MRRIKAGAAARPETKTPLSEQDTPPEISVIVPVWNDAAGIRRCLAALTGQSIDRGRYEIIVIDNASTDETAAAARDFPGVTVLHEAAPGSYAARNRGLAAARGSIVAFTDADCTPAPDWLERGLEALAAHPQAGAIAGRIDLYAPEGAIDPVCLAYEQLFAFDQERGVSTGAVATANWIGPMAAVREAGGFRAALRSGGDTDLSRRIRAAGRPLVYSEKPVVAHPIRSSREALIGKARRVIGGRLDLHEAKRGVIGWSAKLLREAAGRIRRVIASPRVPARHKPGLIGLILSMLAASIGEIRRIRAGGEPRRA